jgi:ADP-heptose:LPS heptosyltransferase
LFDVKTDGKGLDYFLSEEDKKLPSEIESLIPEKFIVLSIGARHNTKKVPPVKLASICDRLVSPVVILGGETDTNEASEILKLSSKKDILDLTGKLSLNKSATVIMLSQLVITHDTGLMHISAAFKKKIISIWGNTIPEFGMYPYRPGEDSKIFEVKGLSCRPCSKIGFDKCPKGHFNCMMQQNEEEIAVYVNKLII